MSYLISGLPRTRTAWLAALMGNCVHDAVIQGYPIDGSINVIDPTVACTMPTVTGFDVRIGLSRSPLSSRLALQEWVGSVIPELIWDGYVYNYSAYLGTCDKIYKYEQLDDDKIVGEIVKLCTNKVISSERIKLFQTLRIEEHKEKMAHRLGIRISRSTSHPPSRN